MNTESKLAAIVGAASASGWSLTPSRSWQKHSMPGTKALREKRKKKNKLQRRARRINRMKAA